MEYCHQVALRQAWAALRHPSHADWLLHACGWRRIDALAALAPHYAEPLDAAEVLSLLDAALQGGQPLALDVDQAGERQHYHGSVERLSVSDGQWVFRLGRHWLHLAEAQIDSAWIVHTPARHALASSVELFDSRGRPLLTLRDAHEPGQRDACHWRLQLAALARTPLAA